ncbi:MAG TPA: GGDEF domain-containing protein [Candidatus Saccharimonadales bacterium]|nr:GGDEF domain-containing protein [Candidatus Saccharimonadales bacterium]
MGGPVGMGDAARVRPMGTLRRSFAGVPLWTAYLALGALAVVLHSLVIETGSLTQSFLYDVIGASAVAAAFVGIWVLRPDRALPWLLMAWGQALFVAGDLVWNYYELVGEDPFPSTADALYLAGYPLIALGLLLLIRRRVAGGDRGGVLDAGILTTAAAILSWTFLMQPQVVGSELDQLSFAITLAYPVADLLLIGVAMGLLTTPGARTRSFQLLGSSLVVLLVADQIYALQNLEGTYVSGGPIDTLYLAAYLMFGASVLHPSMRRLTDPYPVAVTWLGPVRMICLAGAMVTGPLLLTLGPQADTGLLVIAVGTAVLSLLVLARLAGLVGLLARDVAARRVLEAKLSYQAFHDPLTGLANRRRFVEAAEAALGSRRRVGSVAALFLDLDDFKTVNDSQGHAAGDELLVAVAERIRSGLRETDLASRLGGDEFGILLVDIPEAGYASSVATRLLAALEAPIEVAGTTVTVGASIGVALDSAAMADVDHLLADADIAMYQAKALGKGRHQVFTPGSNAVPNEPHPIEAGDGADGRGSWLDRRPTMRRPASPPRLEPEAG